MDAAQFVINTATYGAGTSISSSSMGHGTDCGGVLSVIVAVMIALMIGWGVSEWRKIGRLFDRRGK